MGCTSSSPEAVKDDKNTGQSMEEKKKMEAIANQRRRLSVAPKQVGPLADEQGQPEHADEKPITEAANGAVSATPAAKTDAKAEDAGAAPPAEQPKKSLIDYVSLSKKGFVPYNRNKVNQDRCVVALNLGGYSDVHLFAVFDGHGEHGHEVAQFCMTNLPRCLSKQETLKTDTPKAILKAVKTLCEELATTQISLAFSGTTAIFAILNDRSLFVANIGDSRCVLCRKNEGRGEAVPLSEDQKPENPEEKKRILNNGGRVEPLPGPPGEDCGPPRVWLAEVDVPGLAMSRSIGDEVSQTVGVISVPEIKLHDIDSEDEFIVLASDGVWEFISNQEAVDTIRKQIKTPDAAAQSLVTEAHKRWVQEEEVVDDITCESSNIARSSHLHY